MNSKWLVTKSSLKLFLFRKINISSSMQASFMVSTQWWETKQGDTLINSLTCMKQFIRNFLVKNQTFYICDKMRDFLAVWPQKLFSRTTLKSNDWHRHHSACPSTGWPKTDALVSSMTMVKADRKWCLIQSDWEIPIQYRISSILDIQYCISGIRYPDPTGSWIHYRVDIR